MAKIIGFLGGPSTGKTTLAQSVLKVLTLQGKNAAWANEFVSEDVARIGAPTPEFYIYEQYRYVLMQYRRERKLAATHDFVLTDAPLLLGYAYALQNTPNPYCARQQKLREDFVTLFHQDAHNYDHLYLLNRETTFENNGIRFHSEEQSLAYDALLKSMLDDAGVTYTFISGTVEERTHKVLADITKTAAAA